MIYPLFDTRTGSKLKEIFEVNLISLDERETTKRKRLVRSNYFWASIGICMMVGFILTGILIMKFPNSPDKNLQHKQSTEILPPTPGKY